MSEARVTGPGPVQLRELSVKLKTADPHLRRGLRRELRQALDPVADKVRASILSMPSHHDGTLRGEIARTVYVSVGRVSVSIVSEGRRMPAGKQTLPVHTDRAKGWGHPVYARGPRFRLAPSRARRYRHLPESWRPQVKRGAWTWAHQVGKPGWFETPVYESARELQAACQRAMDDTARMLS